MTLPFDYGIVRMGNMSHVPTFCVAVPLWILNLNGLSQVKFALAVA